MLQADWDGTFSEMSFGFRPGRSAHQAVEQAQAYIATGHGFVVDIDLEKFFDRVNHDVLMGLIAKRVGDKRILKLIRAFLSAGVMEGGLVSPTEEGTPQGGPLSPLLSNLMLDVLDKELEKRGHRFVRYADDCNIYVRSQRAGERVMAGIEKLLAKRLKLKMNKAKSAVAKPSVRKFLGFSFTGGKESPRRRIAPQAVGRFKTKVRELTRRTRGRSLTQIIKELPTLLDRLARLLRLLPAAPDCPNLSSRVHSDSAEGGNRPLVGRHDVREAVRPPREIPDGPFLCYDTCVPAHFAGVLTLVLGRSRLTGAYCACRTAIGRTSNKSAAAKLGPIIVLPTPSTLRIAEKPSANTDAFQA